MCLSSSTPKVEQYKTSAQSQEPDNGAIQTSAARRATDKLRAGASTILTGANGVLQDASTQKSVLLGV
ncbi:conserved hypothetical protein [uncultured Pleomorphomonas sp.]|uniref:Uncharacterized protein n=2 Tax=Pleomorphomonas TaxID=261933 RepID=A0A2G9WND1_9HYPH|nr:hypothetical protein [Pleomorphomonas carboxyditropha]PIO96217.1 hypothetical protein CJ014_26630 [Pleomorphomonas carboxyditropha]SCM79636.1 conserved hypothetical protein [uncultured Pleomorphomonas sp.]